MVLYTPANSGFPFSPFQGLDPPNGIGLPLDKPLYIPSTGSYWSGATGNFVPKPVPEIFTTALCEKVVTGIAEVILGAASAKVGAIKNVASKKNDLRKFLFIYLHYNTERFDGAAGGVVSETPPEPNVIDFPTAFTAPLASSTYRYCCEPSGKLP